MKTHCLTLFLTGLGLYLCEVQLSDFATNIFGQATGKRDHACQLSGISSDQLKIGPVEQIDDMSHRQGQFELKINIWKQHQSKQTIPHPLQCQHLGVNRALLSHQSVQFNFHFFLHFGGEKI